MAESQTARKVFDQLIDSRPAEETENQEIFRIGDLAREFDVSLRTLRFYEDRGLMQPRRSGSVRLYSKEDRKRLILILVTKSMGFTLVDIEEILHLYDLEEANDRDVMRLREKLDIRLEMLFSKKSEIEMAITTLQQVISNTAKPI